MKSRRIALDRLMAVRRRLRFNDITPMKGGEDSSVNHNEFELVPTSSSMRRAAESVETSAAAAALACATVAVAAPVTISQGVQCDLNVPDISTSSPKSTSQSTAETLTDDNNNNNGESHEGKDEHERKPANIKRIPSVTSIKRRVTGDSMFKLFRRKILRSM